MRKISSLFLASFFFLALSSAAFAEAPEISINPRLLLQPRLELTQDGNMTGDGWGTDWYMKRVRPMLSGNVTKWVHFFFEADNPNFGKGGNFNTSFFVQDAVIMFRFMPEFNLHVGLLLPSFVRHGMQGAVSLNALSYHNLFSGKYIAGKVWRDMGVEARGVIGGMLTYDLGVYQGIRGTACEEGVDCTPVNPDELPRVTARVAYHFFDVDDGLFLQGIYHGKRKVLSVGLAADFQPDAVKDNAGALTNYMAFGADVMLNLPLNDRMEIAGQVNFVYFDRGYTGFGNDELVDPGTGYGIIAEAGFRYLEYEPVISTEMFMSDNDGGDISNMHVGFNYWIKGHNANVKLDYGLMKTGNADRKSQVVLQAQILF